MSMSDYEYGNEVFFLHFYEYHERIFIKNQQGHQI